MQSEARLESGVLIVHVMAEVVCLQVRLEMMFLVMVFDNNFLVVID